MYIVLSNSDMFGKICTVQIVSIFSRLYFLLNYNYRSSNTFSQRVIEEVNLTEKILEETMSSALENSIPKWIVVGIPTIGFYRALHNFLKRWPVTKSLTKTSIGRFYIAIDDNLRKSGGRPDNVYRYVERIAFSDKSCTKHMVYNEKTMLRAMQKQMKNIQLK